MTLYEKMRRLHRHFKDLKIMTWFASLIPDRFTKQPLKQPSFRKWSASIVFVATEYKLDFNLAELPEYSGGFELKRNKSNESLDSRTVSESEAGDQVPGKEPHRMDNEEANEYSDVHRIYNIDNDVTETVSQNEVTIELPGSSQSELPQAEDSDDKSDETQTILDKDDGPREVWNQKAEYMLSVIGYAVDLANVWRFPHLCYKNGGGAFLIPYFTMLLLCAMPVFLMEMCLGQYHRLGPISIWRMTPIFKGIGFASCFMAYIVAFYYNIIIGWAFFYLFSSFTTDLPWTTCGHSWNTGNCWQPDWNRSELNSSYYNKTVSPTNEFFERGMLQIDKSSGIDDVGGLRWPLVFWTLLTFIILYFSLWKGVKSSGKVVWFTATVPYIILAILLVRGATLPGAEKGIKYFITPNISRLNNPQVWIDAAVQIMFSVGAGFGTHIAFSSYNKFNNNCFRDCLITVAVNSFTSVFSGFVIFSYLGYMSVKSNKDIDQVATEGPGLVFIVYPEAISTLPGSTIWALIFFLMLITLGLDSAFGGLESPLTGLKDEFKKLRKFHFSREFLTLCIVASAFIFSLPCLTEGGVYIFNILDTFAAGTSILFTVFSQVIAISWFYGIEEFCNDIEEMTGIRPGIYWRICWKFISPMLLLILVITSIINYVPLSYTTSLQTYTYPGYSNILGWCIALSVILLIPGFAVFKLIKTPGTFKERLALCISPEWEHTEIKEKKVVKRFKAKHWLSI